MNADKKPEERVALGGVGRRPEFVRLFGRQKRQAAGESRLLKTLGSPPPS
jgi:hypothetical protein